MVIMWRFGVEIGHARQVSVILSVPKTGRDRTRQPGLEDSLGFSTLAICPSPSNIGTIQRPNYLFGLFPIMSHSLDSLSRLMQTLLDRAEQRPAGSYTTKLLDGGAAMIGVKIREEAEELIEAAGESGDEGRDHFIYEAGDLIYHTLVLLAWRGVDLQEVAQELARREGTSGLAEKASRTGDSDLSTSSESE